MRVGRRSRWRVPSAIERTRRVPEDRPGFGGHARSCQNPAVSEPRPPVAPARPTRLVHRRRRAHRPVVLAARARRPRGDRVPRGRERLHPRRARPPARRCAASSSTRSSGRVQETDTTRAGPARRYEYFTRTSKACSTACTAVGPPSAAALPDPLARAGIARRRARGPRRERAGRGPRVLRGGRSRRRPGAGGRGLQHRHHRRRALRPALPRVRRRRGAGGPELDDVVPDVYYGVAWANDGATIFYTRPDDAMRPWQIWRHTLGTPPDDDVLVFQEDDDRFYVSVGRTRSGRFLVITSASKVTTRGLAGRRRRPRPRRRRVVEPREQGHEYHVEHHAGPGRRPPLRPHQRRRRRELRARRSRRSATPGRASWTTVLPHRDDIRLDDVDAFAGFLVVSERADGLERLRVLDPRRRRRGRRRPRASRCPRRCTPRGSAATPSTTSTHVRYQYTSLVSPASAYDYDPATRTATLVKRQPVPGYDPERYESRRVWATAPDGTAGADLDRVPARLREPTSPARCCSTATARTRSRSTRRSRRRG